MSFSDRRKPPGLRSAPEPSDFACRLCGAPAATEVHFEAELFAGEDRGMWVGLCERHDTDAGRCEAFERTLRFRAEVRELGEGSDAEIL